MIEKRAPGLCALHAVITDQCRENRGDAGALDEAFDRIRQQYERSVKGWRGTPGVKFHVLLTVERPQPSSS